MAVIETAYSVGDRVWYAGTTTEQRQHPCPDCKGERKWKATSPAGDEFEFACPRCQASYSSFDDMSLKYTAHTPAVERLTIGSVRYDSAPFNEAPRNEYMCQETGVGSGRIYKEHDLFPTEEEALQAAEMRAKLANSQVGWIAERFNKTLAISDYQITNAAMKAAHDERTRAGQMLWNLSDLFSTIEKAADKDAILEAIQEYRSREWESDKRAAIADTHPKDGDAKQAPHGRHASEPLAGATERREIPNEPAPCGREPMTPDLVGKLCESLRDFTDIRDQFPQSHKLIDKKLDGLSPVTVTVTKDQYLRAVAVLRKAASA